MQMEMKKKKKRRKEKRVFFSSLNDCKFSKTKLPRLVITKFDGTHFDWFRFGDQFESQIDKCDLPKVAKFRKVLKKQTVRNPIPLSDKRNPKKGNSHCKCQKAKQTKS